MKKKQKDFESEKKRLMTEMEAHVQKERDKFEKNKKVFEWQHKAMKNLPNWKEWQEIDQLKEELKEL